MSGSIFINYRRGTDPNAAGRLFDRLSQAFPANQLFIDVDNIPAGADFVSVLESQVAQSDVLLAIIGQDWLEARDEQGNRRLDNAGDFVRIEIEAGLKLGKRVVPVLVNNAQMPRPEALPEPLRPLALRNAVRLTHERFRSDAEGLIKVLETILEEAELSRQADRDAKAAVIRQHEEQESARKEEAARVEKEKVRQAAIVGLSPKDIAKAEELANWEYIKNSSSEQDVRDHLARFLGSSTERMARTRLEDLAWKSMGKSPSLEALASFLEEFPDGVHAGQAKKAQEKGERRRRLGNQLNALATETTSIAAGAIKPQSWKKESLARDVNVVRSLSPAAKVIIGAVLLLVVVLLFSRCSGDSNAHSYLGGMTSRWNVYWSPAVTKNVVLDGSLTAAAG